MIAADTSRSFSPRQGASRLDQMLQDPLIRLMMASDGVADADIRSLASRVTAHRAAPTPSRNACTGCA